MPTYLTVILIVIAALAAAAVVASIVRWIARVGRKAEGLIDQINAAQIREHTMPKSLSSIEGLLLPQIRKDFPDYNASVIAERVKQDAHTFYESAIEGEVLFDKGVSESCRQNMQLPDDVAGGIVIHRAALAAYVKQGRDRQLNYQVAAQYDDKQGETWQKRLTLKYIAAYNEDFTDNILVIKCPNCGAPVPSVGDKVCRYCGAQLRTASGYGWVLTEIKQD
ncbi:MAG: zinc ribbon domain-containing protein [Clostridia bacterium]|nr:zinc ribbon domain-containing protein [Clostridia bacterium]